MDDVNIQGAALAITKQLKIPVCLEMEELDPAKDGVTDKKKIDRIQAKSEEFSEKEKSLLLILPQIIKTGPNAVISWKLPRITNKISAADFAELTARLQSLFPRYIFAASNTYMTIVPSKGSLLADGSESIKIINGTLGSCLKTINPLLEAKRISASTAMMDPREMNVDALPIPALVLEKKPLSEVLTRICQASGRPLVWTLGAMKGSRILTISTVALP